MNLDLEVKPYVLESKEGNPVGIVLSWEEKELGYGEIEFWFYENKTKLFSENMSKEFVKAVLCKIVDDSEMIL